MARRRDINDIDDDGEGQIVDYSLDTSLPLEFSVLREDDEILVRSNQVFRGGSCA